MPNSLQRPIRVVMFGSGPSLTYDARQFLCRLATHPEIELVGAFCQAEGQTVAHIFRDLWRRRGILALPLFGLWVLRSSGRFLLRPRQTMAVSRGMAQLADRLHFVTNIHAPQVLAQVQALNPDLGLIYGSPILKHQLFEIPTLGTLGIHHGKVPDYRGNKTTFWAMYNGEATAGVTIQKINKGLDTGQIVKEGTVPIGLRSQSAVWHDLEALGLDLYIQAILDVKKGTASYRPQPSPKGQLYKNPKLKDLLNFGMRQLKRRLNAYGKDSKRVKP